MISEGQCELLVEFVGVWNNGEKQVEQLKATFEKRFDVWHVTYCEGLEKVRKFH